MSGTPPSIGSYPNHRVRVRRIVVLYLLVNLSDVEEAALDAISECFVEIERKLPDDFVQLPCIVSQCVLSFLRNVLEPNVIMSPSSVATSFTGSSMMGLP